MNKRIEATAKNVQTVLKNHAAELEALANQHAAEQAKIDTIREAMRADELAGDLDAYEREAAKLNKAQTRAEFFKSVIDHKKEAQRAELQKLAEEVTAEVTEEIDKCHDADAKELCKAAQHIVKYLDEANETRSRAAAVIKEIRTAAGIEWTQEQENHFARYDSIAYGRPLIARILKAAEEIKAWDDSQGTRLGFGAIPDGMKEKLI